MSRTLIWSGLESWRAEIAHVDAAGDGLSAVGTQIGIAYELRYELSPKLLRVEVIGGTRREVDLGEADFFDLGYSPLLNSLPVFRDGLLVVRDVPTEDNKTAADFYNSELWPKVRLWERLFWVLNGGEKRARDVVLRRLPKHPGLCLLDVAIGDGVYTSWLPEDWSIIGVDVAGPYKSDHYRY